MDSLEYAQNGIRLPLTDGRDYIKVDADNPTLLLTGPEDSTILRLIETFKSNLETNYDSSSYRLIEFTLTDDNIQPFVNSCNKDLDSLSNELLVKGLYMTRDLEDFKGQIILLVDTTQLTRDSQSFTDFVLRVTTFTSKYGIYLIALNVGDDIHISTKAFSSISITCPTIDMSYKLYDNPFISIMIHPHHYFFKYMKKVESDEQQSGGIILTFDQIAVQPSTL